MVDIRVMEHEIHFLCLFGREDNHLSLIGNYRI